MSSDFVQIGAVAYPVVIEDGERVIYMAGERVVLP